VLGRAELTRRRMGAGLDVLEISSCSDASISSLNCASWMVVSRRRLVLRRGFFSFDVDIASVSLLAGRIELLSLDWLDSRPFLERLVDSFLDLVDSPLSSAG
jgi:hypothetical protein